MKTLREIQDEVARLHGNLSYESILEKIEDVGMNRYLVEEYFYDCFIEIQRQVQHKINKRVEDDYLNDNFDSQSIINDNNLIR